MLSGPSHDTPSLYRYLTRSNLRCKTLKKGKINYQIPSCKSPWSRSRKKGLERKPARFKGCWRESQAALRLLAELFLVLQNPEGE